jgi:hypothetical protein
VLSAMRENACSWGALRAVYGLQAVPLAATPETGAVPSRPERVSPYRSLHMRPFSMSPLFLLAIGATTLASSGCGKSSTALVADGAAGADTAMSTGSTSGGSGGTEVSQGSGGTNGSSGVGGTKGGGDVGGATGKAGGSGGSATGGTPGSASGGTGGIAILGSGGTVYSSAGGSGPGGGGGSSKAGGSGTAGIVGSASTGGTTVSGGRGGDGGVGPGSDCPGAIALHGEKFCRDLSDCASLAGWYECTSTPQMVQHTAPYCPPTPPGPSCKDDTECTTGTICEPYGSNNCGYACLTGCTSTSCGVQNRCNASFRCEAIPCSEGYPCPVDDVCALSGKTDATHGCRAQACTSGYVCPSGKHCAVGAMGADSHGCEADPCSQTGCPMNRECLPGGWPTGGCQLRKCASDADCDCGYCVLGTCAERLNICAVRFY